MKILGWPGGEADAMADAKTEADQITDSMKSFRDEHLENFAQELAPCSTTWTKGDLPKILLIDFMTKLSVDGARVDEGVYSADSNVALL